MPDSETSESTPPRRVREPSALSSEYHKAHKQLTLWATILLIWELVGVDLGKAKDAGGNIGPIIAALKSPQAVPWALLGLVLYFLFKCSIEWGQCHSDRRKVILARVDFGSAWAIALSALALYIIQTIKGIQFADVLQRHGNQAGSTLSGLALGALLTASTASIALLRGGLITRISLLRLIFFAMASVGLVLLYHEWTFLVGGLIAGILLGSTVSVWFRRHLRPVRTGTEETQTALPKN